MKITFMENMKIEANFWTSPENLFETEAHQAEHKF